MSCHEVPCPGRRGATTRAPGYSSAGVASASAQGRMEATEPVKPWLITTPMSPSPMWRGRASGQTDVAAGRENSVERDMLRG